MRTLASGLFACLVMTGCLHFEVDSRLDAERTVRSEKIVGVYMKDLSGSPPAMPGQFGVYERVERTVRIESFRRNDIDWKLETATGAFADREWDGTLVAGCMLFCIPAVAIDVVMFLLSAPVAVPIAAFQSIDETEDVNEEVVANLRLAPGRRIRVEAEGRTWKARTDREALATLDLGSYALERIRKGEQELTLDVFLEKTDFSTRVDLDHEALARVSHRSIASGADTDRWRTLLEQTPEGSTHLRGFVRGQLAREGHAVDANHKQAWALIRQGHGRVVLADGSVVDWTSDRPKLPPRASARIILGSGDGSLGAGETLVLGARVKNTGKGTLYRLQGRVESRVPELDGQPVLYGRLDPGQSLERLVSLRTPRTLPAGAVDVTIRFDELNGYAPAPVAARIQVAASGRPELAVSMRAVEDGSGTSVGNGDGIIQHGESADVVVAVKNVGTYPAIDSELLLEIADAPGVDVFGATSVALGTIEPGAVARHSVSVAVKRGFAGREIPVRAALREHSEFAASHTAAVALEIDARAPRRVIAIDREVRLKQDAPLLGSASDDGRPLGRVRKGSVIHAVGELDDYVQVQYESSTGGVQRAWLRRSSLSFATSHTAPTPGTIGTASRDARAAVVEEFSNAPPLLVLITPEEGQTAETGLATIDIRAKAKDPDGISAWQVLVNGRPVASSGEEARGVRLERRPPQTQVSIRETVSLSRGPNEIAVEAVDAHGERAMAAASVVRSVRDARVVALVVGINDYDDESIENLRFAEADARAVAEYLRSDRSPVRRSEDVTVLLGAAATTRRIEREIEQTLIRGATHPEDMAIFYFAGHGYSVDGKTFLAGRDTELGSLRATGLRASELAEYWADIGADRKILIADACHSGGISGVRGENSVMDALSTQLAGRGTVSFLASGARQVSVESQALGHGVFTWAFLAGLDEADRVAGNRDGRVSAKEMAAYLDREVPGLARKEAARNQTPVFKANTDGAVFLTR